MEVNANLGCAIRGRTQSKRRAILEWETCPADEFIHYWLPLFESGQLRAEDAPISKMFPVEIDYNERCA